MGLEFKDITLYPSECSEINSRDDIKISAELFPNTYLSLPIIAAPMKDVCDGKVAKEMRRLGGYGILHRFCTIEEQVAEFIKADKDCAAAIGVNGDYIERLNALYNSGCRNFCLDVANGWSSKVNDALKYFSHLDNIYFITGNFANPTNIQEVAFLNFLRKRNQVSGMRFGIAGGTACTTLNATGVYYPMAGLILKSAELKAKEDVFEKYSPAIIADGGIREPQDMCKALALGAEFIMMGSTIAKAVESPAKIDALGLKMSKIYHGSASYENQKTYKENPRYIEGRQVLLEYNGETLETILGRFKEGLLSSMSYMNALTLPEFTKKSLKV